MTIALAGVPAAADAAPSAYVPGEVVVGFTSGVAPSARAHARDAVDATLAQTAGTPRLQRLQLPPGADPVAVAAALRRRAGVAFAAPNGTGRVADGPADPLYEPGERVRLDQAWDFTTGSAATRVGVGDTGVAAHPDLPPITHPGDPHGHGTKVAGVLTALGGNGIGSRGATWTSDLRSFPACDATGACTDADVARAVANAAGEGVRVLNLSVQTDPGTTAWPMTAAAIADAPGLLVVAAAGNGTVAAGGGRDVDVAGQASFPCSVATANVLCVAAVRPSDGLYPFTNWGATGVDLAAPGSNAWTTALGGTYARESGTSFSAPVVAGVAALLWTHRPGATVADVRAALLRTDAVPVLSGRTATGGRLDALQALAAIDGPPSVAIADAPAERAVHFTASEPHVTFECRLDEWTPCGTSLPYEALPDGTSTVRVRATDAAGLTGELAERTIDRTGPEVTFSAPAAHVDHRDVDVAFDADATATTVECRLDAGAFAPCVSPYPVTSTTDGERRMTVRATDDAGNATEATRAWTVDTLPPTTTPVLADDALRFDAGDDPSTFACALDGGAAVPCTSPVPLAGGGDHTFTVTPTDLAGNVGDPQTVEWTGTGGDPVLALVTRPRAFAPDGDTALGVLSDDAAVTCALDGAAPAPCDGLGAVGDGDHAVEVAAGDTVLGHAWTVDRAAPAVDLAEPDSPTADPRPALAWTVAEARLDTVRCTLDGTAVECGDGAYRPAASLVDGRHAFALTATDRAGNATTETARWTSDTQAPALTGLALLTGEDQVPDKPRLTWTAPEGAIRCALDGAAPVACAPGWGADGVAEGRHVATVTATDAAGNARTATVEFDVAYGATTITAATVTGTTADLAFAFVRGASRFEYRVDGGDWTATTARTARLGGLAPGDHAIAVRAVAPEPGTTATTTLSVAAPPEPATSVPSPATPTPTPRPQPTATPPTTIATASTARLTRLVKRRFARRTGPAAARVKPFRGTYAAATAGTLRVRVQLRAGRRWLTVAGGRRTYTTASRRTVRVAVTRAGARVLRRAGRSIRLRIRVSFAPGF